MADEIEVVDVMGWQLSVFDEEDDPLIRDVDLAVRLGYERPRDIRQLIDRLIKAGNLKEIKMRGAVQRIEIRPDVFREEIVNEYWLTQKQALKVIMRSDADLADAIQDEVIDVYVAYRQERLRPALLALQFQLTPNQSATSIWGDWLVNLLRKLYGKAPWDGKGPFPGWGWHMAEIYRIILGDEAYEYVKSINPHPQSNSLHYQYFHEAMHKRVSARDMDIVQLLLRQAPSWKEFRARLLHAYQRAPLQLSWGG